ncbi:hypothetical protein MJH12_08120, partial [bacterium]|nr:hypothetical protein [bacterium]
MNNTFSKLIRLQQEILNTQKLPEDFQGFLLSLFSKLYDFSQVNFLICFQEDSPYQLIDNIGMDHHDASLLIPQFDTTQAHNSLISEYGPLTFHFIKLETLNSKLIIALSFPSEIDQNIFDF